MSDYPMLISNKLHSFRNFNKRSYNSWYISEEQGAKNRNEFVRVCNMSRQELEEYILSWK